MTSIDTIGISSTVGLDLHSSTPSKHTSTIFSPTASHMSAVGKPRSVGRCSVLEATAVIVQKHGETDDRCGERQRYHHDSFGFAVATPRAESNTPSVNSSTTFIPTASHLNGLGSGLSSPFTSSPPSAYRNRTNVRQDSDVDICVRLNSTFNYELPTGVTERDVGIYESPYTHEEFKNDVQSALVSYFGSAAVTRGNKAFDVHANTYRVDADVVPAFELREYYRTDHGFDFRPGVRIIPHTGPAIDNYPAQHYDLGIEKNDRTGRRFKRTVRVLKRLRNEMAEEGNSVAHPDDTVHEGIALTVRCGRTHRGS